MSPRKHSPQYRPSVDKETMERLYQLASDRQLESLGEVIRMLVKSYRARPEALQQALNEALNDRDEWEQAAHELDDEKEALQGRLSASLAREKLLADERDTLAQTLNDLSGNGKNPEEVLSAHDDLAAKLELIKDMKEALGESIDMLVRSGFVNRDPNRGITWHVQALINKHKAIQAHAVSLEQSNKAMKERLAQARTNQQEADELAADFEQLKKETQKIARHDQALREKVSTRTQEAQTARNECREYHSKNNDLIAKLNKANIDLDRTQAKVRTYGAEIATLRPRVAELEKQLETSKDNLATCTADKEATESALVSHKEELAAADDELKNRQGIIDYLRRRIARLRLERDQARHARKGWRQARNLARKLAYKKTLEVAQLNQTLAQANQDYLAENKRRLVTVLARDQYHKQVATLTTALAQANEREQELRNEKNKLAVCLGAARAENSRRVDDIINHERRIEALCVEVEEEEDKWKEVCAEKHRLEVKLTIAKVWCWCAGGIVAATLWIHLIRVL